MTSEELGPEYQTIFDPKTCFKRGLCPVTKGDPNPLESHSLYYEIHGTGKERIVFIMGLNSTSFSWWNQVAHFGPLDQYQVLVFDNRGVGSSDTPKGPYTTSGMAEDAVQLLKYIGWTDKRSFHVVGISLGGMIAQELSSRISEKIISLTLAVTTPGGRIYQPSLPPWFGVQSLARATFNPVPETKVPIILNMLFTQEWLNSVDPKDPKGRTNYDVQFEGYIARIAITRPQKPAGSLSQMAAAMTHYVSPDRLAKISASIPKVLIITGDTDHLVKPANSKYIKKHMKEAEYIMWDGTGHAIQVQQSDRFNETLERVFSEGKQRLAEWRET